MAIRIISNSNSYEDKNCHAGNNNNNNINARDGRSSWSETPLGVPLAGISKSKRSLLDNSLRQTLANGNAAIIVMMPIYGTVVQ